MKNKVIASIYIVILSFIGGLGAVASIEWTKNKLSDMKEK
jgi:hypothetical protein